MRRRTALAGLLGILAGAGCGRQSPLDRNNLRIMVPNAPGSGYDITARTVAKVLEDTEILRGVEVFNLAGGGGLVGLQRMLYEQGNAGLLMLMGQGMVGAQHQSGSKATLQQTTPIARLVEEPEIVVVNPDSPYAELRDLIAGWRADPAAVAVGGGSLPGGPDHLAPMLIAKAVGIAPRQVEYIRYDGGGELLAAILGRRVSFAVSGIGEYTGQITSGQLRVLAVTSSRRILGLSAPTLQEAGVDVVFTNWRGLVAPPGLDAQEVALLSDAMSRLHASVAWQQAMERNRWTDAYLAGGAFADFIAAEVDRVEKVMADLGLK